MQLSDAQIQQLFQFTEKKSVRWYDLQIELVDHLASRIEEEMDTNKAISFENALEKVYKDFGLFGFAKVVQEKQSQLQRAAQKLWWQEVRAFFTWPKVILLALIVSIWWTLTKIVHTDLLVTAFIAGYLVTGLAFFINTFRYNKARKKLLLLQFGANHVSSAIFLYEMMVWFTINYGNTVIFCIYATIGIVFKLASFQLYNKVKENAARLYPKVFA